MFRGEFIAIYFQREESVLLLQLAKQVEQKSLRSGKILTRVCVCVCLRCECTGRGKCVLGEVVECGGKTFHVLGVVRGTMQ